MTLGFSVLTCEFFCRLQIKLFVGEKEAAQQLQDIQAKTPKGTLAYLLVTYRLIAGIRGQLTPISSSPVGLSPKSSLSSSLLI